VTLPLVVNSCLGDGAVLLDCAAIPARV
jgi:hypothetical protein